MSRGGIQFLLVVVPVLSLIGTWLALRGVGRPWSDKEPKDKVDE